MACGHAQSYAITTLKNTQENSTVNAKNNNLKSEVINNHLAINVDSAGHLHNKDLAAFAKKIEGVRILALGEQTHGAGSVFALKTQLIKYLHQHHGFDLFILESGMYDVREIYQQAKSGQ